MRPYSSAMSSGLTHAALENHGYERAWLVAVLVMSLPALLFVVLHRLYVPQALPEFLDLPLAWTLTFTGIFGGYATMQAFILSFVATFRWRVSVKAKLIMWALTGLSFLGWMYAVGVHI